MSNLALQKLVYLAHVEHADRYDDAKLVDTAFEAWDLGPVSPDLYHKLKLFGSSPVRDVFYDARTFKNSDPRRDTMIDVCEEFIGKRPGELVEISHWDYGAWARKYEPRTRGIVITDEDIRYEIRNRKRHARTWNDIIG